MGPYREDREIGVQREGLLIPTGLPARPSPLRGKNEMVVLCCGAVQVESLVCPERGMMGGSLKAASGPHPLEG